SSGTDGAQCAVVRPAWVRVRLPQLRHSSSGQRGNRSRRIAGGSVAARARTARGRGRDATTPRAPHERPSHADENGAVAPRVVPGSRKSHDGDGDHARAEQRRSLRDASLHRGSRPAAGARDLLGTADRDQGGDGARMARVSSIASFGDGRARYTTGAAISASATTNTGQLNVTGRAVFGSIPCQTASSESAMNV